MSKKKKVIIGSVILIGLIVIVLITLFSRKKDQTVVQTGKIERKEVLESKVSASGEIRAKEFVDIQTEVPGVITKLNVREGDAVKKGDTLLTIDPVQNQADMLGAQADLSGAVADASQYQVQIATTQANLLRDQSVLISARADLEQARTNHARAKASFARKQQLHEENLLSREEYDMSMAEMKNAKAQQDAMEARVGQMEAQLKASQLAIDQMKAMHESARSRVKRAEARLASSKNLLDKTTIRSPLSGIITKLNVEAGERAVPGIQSNPQATLMTIGDMSVVRVELKVDETDIVGLSLGDKAKVKVDALPDRVVEGTVVEIGNSPINSVSSALSSAQQQEAKDFKVRVELKDPPKELRPGLSATAEITTKVKKDVLIAPLQAMTIREVPVDDKGNYIPPDPAKTNKKNSRGFWASLGFGSGAKEVSSANSNANAKDKKIKKKELEGVFVITKDKAAKFRPVKTGIKGDTDIEVIQGLEESEEIITGSYKTLRTIEDGTVIKVDNAKKATPEK